MLFRAARELATARNIFGAVPKAPLISSSSGFAAPVAVAGSTRFTLGMDVSFACMKAVGVRTRPAVWREHSAPSSRRMSRTSFAPPPGERLCAHDPTEKVSWPDFLARAGADESVPGARHFGAPRLLMFSTIEAQGAGAEGRIDERAVMRLRRLPMHIRPE